MTNYFVLLILTTPVQFWVGWQFYQGAWIALKNRISSDMNTLIALALRLPIFTAFPTLGKKVITGESMSVGKKEGDEVIGATMNLSGF